VIPVLPIPEAVTYAEEQLDTALLNRSEFRSAGRICGVRGAGLPDKRPDHRQRLEGPTGLPLVRGDFTDPMPARPTEACLSRSSEATVTACRISVPRVGHDYEAGL
jgi:hypothetical protein